MNMILDTRKKEITTYILHTSSDEYYCGKTNNIIRRMFEHKEGKNGSWFNSNKRMSFKIVFKINDDFEKKIKSFGVKKFIYCINRRGV